jgi:uncharacterized membrane protein YdjX (TVP38/TMEM64 family)
MRSIAHDGPRVFRLAAMLVAFVVSLAAIAYGLRDELLDVVVWGGETMREAPLWGAFIFFLASAGSVLFLFLSSTLLVPSAILVWGEWPTFLLLSSGWLAGWTATYAIGRFFRDRAFVGNKLGGHPLEKTFFLSGKLPFSLVLIAVCSLPAEIPGYALGAARYPFGPFLLAVALAEIPFAFLIVFIGESFILENVGLFAGLIVVLCGILVWEVRSAHRLRRLS